MKYLPLLLFSLVVIAIESPVHAGIDDWKYTEIDRLAAPEARQGVAIDDEFLYVISNHALGKYRRDTGERVAGWSCPEGEPLTHLNAGLVHDGILYCAHSNFPGVPMVSSIEMWDTDSMNHIGARSLGRTDGSLTWIDRYQDGWVACFVHYGRKGGMPGRGPEWTRLVRFDSEWRQTGGWVFPDELMEKLGERGFSVSGGAFGPNGFLYVTGHDHPELYVLEMPTSGSVLQWVATIPISTKGQAFAWDKHKVGLLFTISKADREVVTGRVHPAGKLSVSDGLMEAYPFKLGVASGDPAPDGFVLWTRLVRNPRKPDGGMEDKAIEVRWLVAEDEAMQKVVKEGAALADPTWAHSVHIEVEGLPADRWYWYRFEALGATSPQGRTRTLPQSDVMPERLRFAFASCQKYEMGYYTAYKHMAREDLDLVVFLGDYIYEKKDSSAAVRPHGLQEALTLEDYRMRYAVYKSDEDLQAAHAAFPWIATWDDHEVSNDYADAVSEDPVHMPRAEFLQRRAAAYRAYYEHMPLRSSARPHGPDLLLYRRLDFGRLARFHVLDTRQYRSDQPPGPRQQKADPILEDPTRTMLGASQREWLVEGLVSSKTVWNIIAQQVLLARVDLDLGSDVVVDVDKWSGYEHERRWLLNLLRDRHVSNPVVITGDIHSSWANELTDDFDRGGMHPVAVEFVGTSISSSGHGLSEHGDVARLLAQNPAVKFHDNQRGYVKCEVTPESWRTDFRTVAYIDRRGAPLQTPASFVVRAGDPRLIRIRPSDEQKESKASGSPFP